MPRKPKAAPAAQTKLFVIDTNILLHDPFSILKFAQHDVYVPFVTLEELDNKKVGTLDVNRNARQATRLLDEIVSQEGHDMASGFPLQPFNGGHATGRLFVQRESLPFLAHEQVHKNDNLYLSVLDNLTKAQPERTVVMVTKDLNLRIKARAMGHVAQDYLHDHAIEDSDLIYRGWREVTEEEWQGWAEGMRSWTEDRHTCYEVKADGHKINEFLLLPGGDLYRVTRVENERATLEAVADTTKDKNAVMGICARNEEQRAALELLLDPEVDLVALLGPAGTGKTLLALAASLEQVEDGTYDDILFTRANTPLGEDIGFLPGTEEEKMAPWLGALFDNVEVLAEAAEGPVEGQKVRALAKEKVQIRAMTFMRGRTFHRRVVILDEAQNLTPKQMKALITRAGEGAKIVVLGNLAQIDSPYLSEASSGLAYLVERFKGWPHFGSLVLEKGERSRLANAGNERL